MRGCTCPKGKGPVYHLNYLKDGRPKYDRVGFNRRAAERKLRALVDEIEDARDLAKLGGRPKERKDATLSAWLDEWQGRLTCSENTRRSYKATVDYARASLGDRIVRTLDAEDIGKKFLDEIRCARPKVTTTTLARHLRVLGAILNSAVAFGYADSSPLVRLPKQMRPKPQKAKPAYFTNAELRRLWAALPDELPGATFKALCRTAVATGMRQGELLALRWSDVRLLDAELTIGRTLVAGIGEQRRTKRGEGATRTIDLTADGVKVLADWLTLSGAAPDSRGLVFARPDGGPLVGSTITRSVLYPVMERAGIPREGEHGRKRTFHSFRHTFARLMLEAGAEITWVQGQLGHSSITLTVDTYGHWARSAEKAQATKMNGVLAEAL